MIRAWWLAALIGCYRPAAYDECGTLCGTDVARTCPAGETCDDNGVCKPVGMAGNCVPRDSGMPDAFEFQDAGIDSPSASQTCFGATGDFFRVCVEPPMNDVTISSAMTIDTSACMQNQVQAMPPAVCVLPFRNLTINAGVTVRVVGPRPLAIVVANSLDINGTIDVASHRDSEQGAGANVFDCAGPAGGAIAVGQTGGGGGGAGGSLVGSGGAGGAGAGGSGGGAMTPPIAAGALARVRGGCPGGSGGKSTSGFAGPGSAGGGAIYLMSLGTISMGTGSVINASGAGGGAPGDRAGGGGGGSGGFIGFSAPNYMFASAAQIYAVGGAGGSGGSSTTPGKGGNEAVGPTATARTNGVGVSGYGGFGAVMGGEDGGGGGAASGGGGGGGGGGMIGFEGQMPPQGQFAPPPTQL